MLFLYDVNLKMVFCLPIKRTWILIFGTSVFRDLLRRFFSARDGRQPTTDTGGNMSGEYRSIMVYTGYELVVTNWGSVGSVFLIDGDSPTGKQFVSPNNGNNLQKKHKRPSTGGWTGATSCSQNYDWLGICCDWSYYHVCGFCSQNLDVPRKKHFASFCLQHLTTAFVHLVAKKSSCFNYNIQFVPCIVPYFILETSNGWTCPPPLPRPLQLPFRMALSWPPKCRQRKEKHMFGIQVGHG